MAFFSVRSFIVAFLRGSVASHICWVGKPDRQVLSEEEAPMHPRASFESFMETSAAEFKEWSPATVDLLEMVSHKPRTCTPSACQSTCRRPSSKYLRSSAPRSTA